MADDTFASSAVADGYVSCIDRIVAHAVRHDATLAAGDVDEVLACGLPYPFRVPD